MRKFFLIISLLLITGGCGNSLRPLTFQRERIGVSTYESATAFDVDMDGCTDIVSAGLWYKGPDFEQSYKIRDVIAHEAWYDDFAQYAMDVDGDGYTDIVTGGWFTKTMRWCQNPKGGYGEWTVHEIDRPGNVETAMFEDIDGDGTPEVLPNLPGAGTVFYKLITDDNGKGTGKFSKYIISETVQEHGLGYGDVDGDGRGDIVLWNGWFKSPKNPLTDKWLWHQEFNLDDASIPIVVYDVDEDGLNDLIVGQAHKYGLAWYQQCKNEKGNRTWTKYDIDPDRSQYHMLRLCDIDNDGVDELVTGKRYYAHLGRDPGAEDPVGVYYFEIAGGRFDRVTLDYGPASTSSGTGMYFDIKDVDGNGYKDIIAPGQEGLYLFKNHGPK